MRNLYRGLFCFAEVVYVAGKKMKLFVIGSGGREHALVWKLAQSPHVTQIWCAPGNAGIGMERLARTSATVECVNIGAEDLPRLLAFALEYRPDMTVVGPDNPLALGVVDLFQKNGLRIWGPTAKAARFEASKVFSQLFMQKYGIPTARAAVFSEPGPASRFAAELGGRCAVKADGLALGKGVIVCRNMAQADEAIQRMLVHKEFGEAGASIVIQELLEGIEISLHALCDGKTAKLFPTSQDHKPAFDNDQGPNTGGMGTYSPTPFLSESELAAVERAIIVPWLRGCAAENIHFCGILYPGVMLTRTGPKVLEFNVRFGDPETQVYLPRLENDLVELLDASINGTLDRVQLRWNTQAAVCVIMASAGYPGKYEKGKRIFGLDEVAKMQNVKVFHAGTAKVDDTIVTNGGRVLGVTALGKDLNTARETAYAAVERIRFDGAFWRRDIAAKALSHSNMQR